MPTFGPLKDQRLHLGVKDVWRIHKKNCSIGTVHVIIHYTGLSGWTKLRNNSIFYLVLLITYICHFHHHFSTFWECIEISVRPIPINRQPTDMIGHQKLQKLRENTHFHVIFFIFFSWIFWTYTDPSIWTWNIPKLK